MFDLDLRPEMEFNQPAEKKGMKQGQKERTGKYMDEFRANNGGCLLCDEKILQFYTEIETEPLELHLFGLCRKCDQKRNNDALCDAKRKVIRLTANLGTWLTADHPKMAVVIYQECGEELRFV